MKRILMVDGNYFAQRSLGTLNMGDRINNLETKLEKESFLNELNSSIINLYSAFAPYIDNIIFCTDNYSWRKEIEPHKPYWITDDRPIKYKENRKETKEESPINYDNFYILYKKFVKSIEEKVHVFDQHGLEGDDQIMLISNKVAHIPDIELIVFCTDGDLVQTVKDNCCLLRNIRSKEIPNGEFVISLNKYKEIFEKTAKDVFFGNAMDLSYYKKLFSICIGNTQGNSKISRSLNQGISIATPFKIALVKSICGDKKDNSFSIIAWKSTTGTIEYKLTEKYLEKALKIHGYNLTEANCQKILVDKEILINLMLALKEVSKQTHVSLETMGKHLKHNLRLIVLSKNNVPENYLENFNKLWDEKQDSILNSVFDPMVFKSMPIHRKDSASDVFEKSIPDIDSIINAK